MIDSFSAFQMLNFTGGVVTVTFYKTLKTFEIRIFVQHHFLDHFRYIGL